MTTGRINQVAPSPRGIGKRGIGIANVSPEGKVITNDTPSYLTLNGFLPFWITKVLPQRSGGVRYRSTRTPPSQ
jgi:hypothetical protein